MKSRCFFIKWIALLSIFPSGAQLLAQEPEVTNDVVEATVSLEELKAIGAANSRYRSQNEASRLAAGSDDIPQPKLALFHAKINPILQQACADCHGADLQEGSIRIDTLDPNLAAGDDIQWWLEVFAVISNGEMPPPDEQRLNDEERAQVVDWLATEIQTASRLRRSEDQHSSFRRMTRYEYRYALQDLLGLPFDFAKDLPPDARSEDGFENSAETLQMSVSQFATYRDLGRQALQRATVRGDQPQPLYWGVSMEAAAEREWPKQNAANQPENQDPPRQAYYKNLSNQQLAVASWSYPEAKYAWHPQDELPTPPSKSDVVAIIPAGQRLIVELGDRIPAEGLIRVRFRACRISSDQPRVPSLELELGWQASNDSHASVRISEEELKITAPPEAPEFYQWEIQLSEIYPRNLVKNVNKLGDLPNPSEYLRFVNNTISSGDVQIDYVEVTAPVYPQWPPASHRRIFLESVEHSEDTNHARRILANFMPRAWRRQVSDAEVQRKLELFEKVRPDCDDFQQAMIEVLATVLASPNFLYLTSPSKPSDSQTQFDLATRLSIFLWCSLPDDQLRTLAAEGRLADPEVFAQQVERLLDDDRSHRFSAEFVRQWLGLHLLDFLQVDRKSFPRFGPQLKEAMQAEPLEFFERILRENRSIVDFLHADEAILNEQLARHYGIKGVYGNEFRPVSLTNQPTRGGLLTQAGLLAMNSDGKDSHPLKRGIWLLEKILDDPPPPPPAAVPQIDLADPEIAKLTLKQRLAQHRDQAACKSCHMKIDPWGIAFEHYDAVGSWRDSIGDQPVDASSLLFNQKELNGVDGLKRFLLEQRQDQFVRAMVKKMMTFALGRPVGISDYAEIDRVAAELRRRGDGLGTLIELIATSELFQHPQRDETRE